MADADDDGEESETKDEGWDWWPASLVLPDALLGLRLGFLPYELKVAIAGLAETRVIYPFNRPPDLPPRFREIEELIEEVSLPPRKRKRRTETQEALDALEQYVRGNQFRPYFDALRRAANAEAKKQAETLQWKGNHRYLQAWLAVHPEVDRKGQERMFDLWYLDAVEPRKSQGQPRTRISLKDRTILDGKGPQPQTRRVNVPAQWDIAMFNAQMEWRQGVVRDLEGEAGTLEDRLGELLAATDPVVSYWAQIGNLLGQILWAGWCPVADEFVEYVPKSMAELVDYPETGVTNKDILLKKWQKAFKSAKPSAWPEPEGDDDEPRCDSWTEYLATWSASKFEFLSSVLRSMKELVGNTEELYLSEHIPPTVAMEQERCCVLGQYCQCPNFATFEIIEALQEDYPRGVPLGGLEANAATYLRRLSKQVPWKQVLVFPGGKGRGGYRLAWPL